jgi:hypothetical protein
LTTIADDGYRVKLQQARWDKTCSHCCVSLQCNRGVTLDVA